MIEETGPECPVLLGREFEEYLHGWAMLQKGFLPRRGGWEEQPRIWVQVFEVIDQAVFRVQQERREQLEAEAANHDGPAVR